jgi:hypothetical protein
MAKSVGGQRPIFVRARKNMVMVVALLDTLPTPSTDGVDKAYQQLKDILDAAAAQQVEISLQRQAEVSISTLGLSKPEWRRAIREPPEVGMASLLA